MDIADDGTAWAQAPGYETGELRVFRVAPNRTVSTVDFGQLASGSAAAEFEDAVADGEGGFYGVLSTNDRFDDQEGEEPSPDPLRTLVHVSASNRITNRYFGKGYVPNAHLIRGDRGTGLAFQDDRGLSFGRVGPGARITQRIRLRRTGALEDAVWDGSTVWALVAFNGGNRRSSRTDGVALQRFVLSGRHRPAVRIARGRIVRGKRQRVRPGSLDVDSRGRVYASWSSSAQRGSTYVRVVSGARAGPARRLWSCAR